MTSFAPAAIAERLQNALGKRSLLYLVLFALAVRLVAIFALHSLNHPDENFQLFEQAHRLVFGYGLEPWEFGVGIRSYLPIWVLAGIFKLASYFSSSAEGYIYAARVFLALVSLLPVVAVYRYAATLSRAHAVVAGVAAACWYEIVYFAIRPLTEAVAFDFLLVALCMTLNTKPVRPRLHDVLLGMALGATAMLRVHLLPAVLFIAFLANGFKLTARSGRLLAGAAVPLTAFGIVDTLTWGVPFHSQFMAFFVNVVQDKASEFGTRPLYYYPALMVKYWGGAVFPLAALVVARAKTYWPWIVTALIILLTHSMIPHKEYRFIFSAVSLLALVAALASVDFANTIKLSLAPRVAGWTTAILVCGWVVTSLSLGVSSAFVPQWAQYTPVLDQQLWVARQPDLCGLGFYDYNVVRTGGYAFLHRNVPLYLIPRGQARDARYVQAYNYVIVRRRYANETDPRFEIQRCVYDPLENMMDKQSGEVCVARRPGPCFKGHGVSSEDELIRRQ